MNQFVYILIDEDKNIVAVYENKDVAAVLKPALEEKICKKIEIKKRTLNPEISTIGLFD